MTKKRAQMLVLVGTGLAIVFWLWRVKAAREATAIKAAQLLRNQPVLF